MTVQKVALGEVCDFVRGVAFDGNEVISTPADGYVPILRAGNIGDELYIRDDLVWVPENRVSEEQYFQVSDIAICMASGSPAVLGKTAQLKEKFIGSVGAFCGIIRPTTADPNYIAYWLKSPNFMVWRDSQANGVNIQNLRPNEIREIKIPLPPLTEQKRIASLLARADRLRQLRRTAHDLGDALLQSVFLEMFGDPVSNEKGWEKAAISDLGKVQTGNTPSREEPENFGNYIEWIKSDNIRDDQFYVSPSREMLSEIGLKKGRSVVAGSIFVTCIAGSLDHVGDTAITNRTVAFNQQINAITPFDDVNSLFLRSMLHVAKPYVQFNASAGMKHIITKSKLEELVLVKPPLSLQEEFAGAVVRVEGLRGRMSEAGRQAEGLFESLLAQSFGE